MGFHRINVGRNTAEVALQFRKRAIAVYSLNTGNLAIELFDTVTKISLLRQEVVNLLLTHRKGVQERQCALPKALM